MLIQKKWIHIKYSVKMTKENMGGNQKQAQGTKAQKTTTNMIDINSTIASNHLRPHGLNAAIKR